jgi:hypothetical protein
MSACKMCRWRSRSDRARHHALPRGAERRLHALVPTEVLREAARRRPLQWTNLLYGGEKTVANCIADKPHVQRINAYGIAFLNATLKGKDDPLLTGAGTGLSTYAYQR